MIIVFRRMRGGSDPVERGSQITRFVGLGEGGLGEGPGGPGGEDLKGGAV